MTAPRLAEVLAEHSERDPDDAPHTDCECGWTTSDAYRTDTHADHLAAVWREVCTIRTLEGLDGLPTGAVVRDAGGDVVLKSFCGDEWFLMASDEVFHSKHLTLPAVLVWHPGWEAS